MPANRGFSDATMQLRKIKDGSRFSHAVEFSLVHLQRNERAGVFAIEKNKKPSVIPNNTSVEDWQYSAIVEEKVAFGIADYVIAEKNSWIFSNDRLDIRV